VTSPQHECKEQQHVNFDLQRYRRVSILQPFEQATLLPLSQDRTLNPHHPQVLYLPQEESPYTSIHDKAVRNTVEFVYNSQGRPSADAAALGPALWCLGRLFIFSRCSLRSNSVETAYKSHC